jgi:hypothetical protein
MLTLLEHLKDKNGIKASGSCLVRSRSKQEMVAIYQSGSTGMRQVLLTSLSDLLSSLLHDLNKYLIVSQSLCSA